MNPYVRQDGMFSRLKPVRKVKKTKKKHWVYDETEDKAELGLRL